MSFHRRVEEEEEGYYGEGCGRSYGRSGGGSGRYPECGYERSEERRYESGPGYSQERREERKYTQNERLGELGALAAGAFAAYEGHEAKTDVEHASKHKHEERLGEAVALGSGGYAIYEHHEKQKYKHNGGW